MAMRNALALGILLFLTDGFSGQSVFKGVIHAHSLYSHDSVGLPSDIIAASAHNQLDFLFMTDHPSEHSLDNELKGEKGGAFISLGSEFENFLALDIQKHLASKSPDDLIKETQAQDGLSFLTHIENWKIQNPSLFSGLTGMEVYNLHYDAVEKRNFSLILDLLKMLVQRDYDGIFRRINNLSNKYLSAFDKLTQHHRLAAIAGNDSHENMAKYFKKMGIRFGKEKPDSYRRTFGFVNTYVIAQERSASAFKAAIRQGRTFVGFESFRRFSKDFSFTVHEENGELLGQLGDDVLWRPRIFLRIQAPGIQGDRTRLRIKRNGVAVHEEKALHLSQWQINEPGIYRVEIEIEAYGNSRRPWVISSPIYILNAHRDH